MATYEITVPNKNGSYDGDMVILNYTSLTINSGNVLTTDHPCRGMIIYVQGDCVINGHLSMDRRAPYANPTSSGSSSNDAVDGSGLRLPFLANGYSDTITTTAALLNGCGNEAKAAVANHKSLSNNGKVVTFVRQGAGGGAGKGTGPGNNGSNGGTGQTGGGGGGGSYGVTSGSGSYGSCWGGGSGGGGADNNNPTNATPWCGPGGNGGGSGSLTSQGGAGNPCGSTPFGGNLSDVPGGGLIALIVGGNLTIGSGGKISANGGANNQSMRSQFSGGGGSCGGGNILIAHRGSYTNNGVVQAIGGTILTDGVPANSYGGTGGNGSIQVYQIK